MFVKPAAGRTIRWPRTMTPLRDAGEHVPADAYWLRAVADGDLVEADPPAEPAEPEAAPPATEAAPAHDEPEVHA